MKYDEIMIDEKYKSASYTVTKEEIMEFASQFDPQYMHIDEEKAQQSIFKGIIASGLHTLCISFKLWTEMNIFGEDIIAGTGVNNLQFTKPVYPEDTLYVTTKVIKKTDKKKSGEVTLLLTSYKHDDIQVLQAEISALVSK
ncbi:MaoC/PaaZ C-terminal domain-containing protein [Bacillaceae bacterium S4-13-56]